MKRTVTTSCGNAIRSGVLCLRITSWLFLLNTGSAMAGNGNNHRITAATYQEPQMTVKGRVLSSQGDPLPGATVAIKNKTTTVMTDAGGNFTIAADSNTVLIVSYTGYQTQEVAVEGQASMTIRLTASSGSLDEVVVVGYSAQKRSTITGSVSSVNIDNMDKRRVSDVAQALQGQVPGVQVTQSTGAPGDPIEIRIRGNNSIGNDNTPLYIIDGVPTTDLTFLNPADIQSMTVLKDASSAAIYGSRAANGVVLITTKQGNKGKSSLDVNFYKGIQRVTNLPELLNASQYMDKAEEAWNNAGYPGTNPYTAEKSRTDLANTDWLDELFETGNTQNLQLTASGGSGKVQYLISGGYYGQDGIVVYKNDRYQRYTFRTNVNAALTDRLTIGNNLQLSYSVQDKLSSSGDEPGVIRHALIRPPVIPVYKSPSDPTWSAEDPFTDLPFYRRDMAGNGVWDEIYELSSNPVALAYFTNDKRHQYKAFGNVFGEYAFLPDKSLKFRTALGIELTLYHNKAFNQNFGDDNNSGQEEDKGAGRNNRPTNLAEERSETRSLTWSNTLNYIKTRNKHYINALVGTEFINQISNGISASRQRYEFTAPPFQYIDIGGTAKDIWNGGSGDEMALFSYFASATYVYDSRFMLTGNFRADASSHFAPNYSWGYFPSVSAGWVISEEDFMRSVEGISNLKLRASLGQLGNQNIGSYTYVTLFKKDGDQYKRTRYGNDDLKWESTLQSDIGVDIGILRNTLSFSLDYFAKKTSGILLPSGLPAIAGDVLPTYINAGKTSNKGFELGIDFHNNVNKFNYGINANLATLKNEVTQLFANLPYIIGPVTKTEAGHPLNAYYGFEMEGIYQNDAEINEHLFSTPNPTAAVKPGDIRFRDINGDGLINDIDRTYLGNPFPKLTYGANFTADYLGFDFSMFWLGVQGVDRYNDSKQILDYDTRPFNHTTAVLNSWHGEGTSNSIPRVSRTDNGSSRKSSIFVEDASYLRLKNIEIGYSFPSLTGRTGNLLQHMRLYVSAQNLLTFTKYTGLDPESTDLIDKGTYPQSKAFLLGLNIRL